MRLFLTGATGFVGSYILREILKSGYTARCLLRPGSEEKLEVRDERVEVVYGDILSGKPLAEHIQGSDAVIHLIGIIKEDPSRGITFDRVHREGAMYIIDQARQAGVGRFVLMSANGARKDGVSEYQISKWKAEEYLKAAGFEHWTIFRPSIVFGNPGKGRSEFVSQLAHSLVKPFPILPVFGDGDYCLQPISVQEVAAAFVQAVTNDLANCQVYMTGGKEEFTYNQILDVIARALGKDPKPKIHQPLWMVKPLVNSVGKMGLLPITPDQLAMLLDGNTGDATLFYRDFDVVPIKFAPENLTYVKG